MKNRRRRGNTGTARSVASQLMGLSLFIMLLAFFIVLNAISSYEESKAFPVMASLGNAFSTRLETWRMEEKPVFTKSNDSALNEGSTIEQLQTLFSAQIPGYKSIVDQGNGVMAVQLSLEAFEEAVLAVQTSGVSSPDKDFFLRTLVALVKTDYAGAPYRMDIVLNINENPANLENSQPQKLSSLMKRMGLVAGKIEKAGLPVKLMSIGIQKGQEETVELLFHRHIPFNPLGEDVNGR
ncbi:MAG: hypothetical protein CO093_05620 [Alphaproteobacteria bacterium CG_4_9_14_3_um_filter_47_13]|nr:MAG: hypothetical protein CO093_05620 [Alphaproteobacteria bacterium CG_4_9_14_3_um_filter_47_13]